MKVNKLIIKPTDKILIIAPHPDDEVLGCGGIMTKYGLQTDCICLNSSGFQEPYEQCADTRISEFNDVMKFFGIKKHWIWKIFGPAPHFDQMKDKENEYQSATDYKQYTHIFIPSCHDDHVEHAYVAKTLVPKLLKRGGYNPNCLIYEYMVWGNRGDKPNVSLYVNPYKKIKALKLYASRNQKVMRKLAGLNGILPRARECFYCQPITKYLSKTEK